MREYKFRGISVKTGEFVYGLLLKNGFHRAYITGFGAYEGTAYPFQRMNELVEEAIPETIGQFTGLKDKNGKEIYEGDILDNRKYKSVVEFYGCGFSAKIYFGGKSTRQHFDLRGEALTSKIVGDIHNNPDLLEVSE